MAATYIEFLTELLEKSENPGETTSESSVDVHISQSLDLTLIDVTGQ